MGSAHLAPTALESFRALLLRLGLSMHDALLSGEQGNGELHSFMYYMADLNREINESNYKDIPESIIRSYHLLCKAPRHVLLQRFVDCFGHDRLAVDLMSFILQRTFSGCSEVKVARYIVRAPAEGGALRQLALRYGIPEDSIAFYIIQSEGFPSRGHSLLVVPAAMITEDRLAALPMNSSFCWGG